MFVDATTVKIRAGRGGDGCSCFRREKFVPRGGPAGGDGGRGGSVIFRATHRVGTLLEISRAPELRGKKGMPGGPNKMSGRSGPDVYVDVPLGTIIRLVPGSDRTETLPEVTAPDGRDPFALPPLPEPEPEVDPDAPTEFDDPSTFEVLCDLTEEGQEFVAGKGGRGGRGNARFASSIDQAPTRCEPGTPGQERVLYLELKLIADVGLVGFPSAGKSTLISRVSSARPKVAAYPFTTLSPVPGIVDLGDHQSCVFADLPGLIGGAHLGVGLGIQFLRHIERTRLVLHLVDAAPLDGKDPREAYREIREELELYGGGLATKPELIVLNKLDLPESEARLEAFREAFPDRPVLGISAVAGTGIRLLLREVKRRLEVLDEEVPA